MPYKLILHPDIHFEIEDVLSGYESVNKALALDFELELIKCYERIAANPLHYFVLHKKLKIRRACIKKISLQAHIPDPKKQNCVDSCINASKKKALLEKTTQVKA